jgi:hypothetical protein
MKISILGFTFESRSMIDADDVDENGKPTVITEIIITPTCVNNLINTFMSMPRTIRRIGSHF